MNQKTLKTQKTYRVQVCMNQKEKKVIERNARKQGMKVSTFLRELGLGNIQEDVTYQIPDWVKSCERMNQVYRLIEESGNPRLLEEARKILKRKETKK